MPLLKVEAEKLDNNILVQGLIEEIIDRDDMFSLIPFMQTNTKAYVYNRESTLSEGQFIAPVDVAVPEGAAEFQEVVAPLKILAGQVRVDSFLDSVNSTYNSQKAIQIAQKAKGLARAFKRTLATGDSAVNPAEFDGLPKYVTAGQTISAGVNGNPLSYDMLDELIDAVPNGADALIMREGTLRAYKALLRTAGGTDAAMMQLENFSRPMLTHNGMPIIVNNFLANDEVQGTSTASSSIYAVRFNEVDGFHGLYGGGSAGFVVEDLGIHATFDSTTTRLKWYCGTALKSTRSVARIKGCLNV